MGWVVMVVDTGDSCHSLYELVIMLMAMAEQATTMATQIAFKGRVLDVEMCTSPWIVELSKNSRKVAITMLNPILSQGSIQTCLYLRLLSYYLLDVPLPPIHIASSG